jgi:hypothetical protein
MLLLPKTRGSQPISRTCFTGCRGNNLQYVGQKRIILCKSGEGRNDVSMIYNELDWE